MLFRSLGLGWLNGIFLIDNDCIRYRLTQHKPHLVPENMIHSNIIPPPRFFTYHYILINLYYYIVIFGYVMSPVYKHVLFKIIGMEPTTIPSVINTYKRKLDTQLTACLTHYQHMIN